MTFKPDSFLVAETLPSPNHGERVGGRAPDMIVLHYTGMRDSRLALTRLCAAESGVSAHYVVMETGHIFQCVPEERRAWHAGESFWRNETDINSCSIGIEIANPGHDHGYPDFPLRQVAAVISLCRSIITRRNIRPERVLAHSDVAPSRKIDPGEKFPWETLHNAKVGHWTIPAPIISGPSFSLGDQGKIVATFQEMLATYGYRTPEHGMFDETTVAAVKAFQRHFRSARVDGVVDSSTLTTLQSLIETLPSTASLRSAPF